MKICSLKYISTEQILEAFNSSFSNYIVPLQLNNEQLESKMRMEKTELDYSVGVFEKNQLMGFILHAVDQVNGKKIVYNSGTGVVPEMRGKSLAKKMYAYILPVLKSRGVAYTLLEVITKNENALRIYEQCGFIRLRELNCYRGTLNEIDPLGEAIIRKTIHPDWDLLNSFSEIEPSWQYSTHVLKDINSELITLEAKMDGQIVGYLLYLPGTKRMAQLAVNKDYRRRGIGTQMLQHIRKEYDALLTVINIDARSVAGNAFMQNTGLEALISQYEMRREL